MGAAASERTFSSLWQPGGKFRASSLSFLATASAPQHNTGWHPGIRGRMSSLTVKITPPYLKSLPALVCLKAVFWTCVSAEPNAQRAASACSRVSQRANGPQPGLVCASQRGHSRVLWCGHGVTRSLSKIIREPCLGSSFILVWHLSCSFQFGLCVGL